MKAWIAEKQLNRKPELPPCPPSPWCSIAGTAVVAVEANDGEWIEGRGRRGGLDHPEASDQRVPQPAYWRRSNRSPSAIRPACAPLTASSRQFITCRIDSAKSRARRQAVTVERTGDARVVRANLRLSSFLLHAIAGIIGPSHWSMADDEA